jgi:outer membrane protein insertion porin family
MRKKVAHRFASGFGGVCVLFALAMVPLASHAVPVARINVTADDDVTVPRILELLGISEQEEFSESSLDKGLARIANTGRYRGVEGRFDPASGTLAVVLKYMEKLEGVDTALRPAIDEDLEQLLRADLNEIVGIPVGDPIHIELVPDIRTRIIERLKDRGYPKADVVIALEQGTGPTARRLYVSVDLGERLFAQQVRFEGFRARDLEELRLALSAQPLFGKYLDPLKVPDELLDYPEVYLLSGFRRSREIDNGKSFTVDVKVPVDWIVFNDAVSQWSQATRARGYFDFRTEAGVTEESDGRTLVIRLYRGERYEVQFAGNTSFWERDLRSRVLDRTLRLGVPLNLQEAQSLIQRLYETLGYNAVHIEVTSTSEREVRKVLFSIDEGPQSYLGELSWDGLSPSEAPTASLAMARWRESLSSPFHRIYYDEKGIKAQMPWLLQGLRDLGFLQARLLGFRPSPVPGSSRVNVEIPVQLGPRFRIRDISLGGRPRIQPEQVRGAIGLLKGDWANASQIQAASGSLARLHREEGYLFTEVSVGEDEIVEYSEVSDEVDLIYLVDPGPRIRVGQVLVDGLRETKERVVLREFEREDFKAGETWVPSRLLKVDERLLGSGLFGSVRMNPVGGRILSRSQTEADDEVQERDLRVTLTERPGGSLEFGPGYRTDLGIIGFGEFNYRNLGGWNRSLLLRAQVSRKLDHFQFPEQTYLFSYREPWLAEIPVALRFSTQYVKSDELIYEQDQAVSGFNLEELSFGWNLDWEFLDHFFWSQNLYSLALPKITERLVAPRADVQTYTIATMGSSVSYDLRDNIFNPKKGFVLSQRAEFSSPNIGSSPDAHFVSYKTDGSVYWSPKPKSTFALAVGFGHIRALGGVQGIPENKRLLLGGRSSIRAFSEGALRFDEPGVSKMWSLLSRLEYRQSFVEDLGLAYFIDAGRINANVEEEGLTTGLRKGAGIGVRYDTPVGPLSLDFAFNLAPLKGEDQRKIQFSIGVF